LKDLDQRQLVALVHQQHQHQLIHHYLGHQNQQLKQTQHLVDLVLEIQLMVLNN
jgi:hypothetical protein